MAYGGLDALKAFNDALGSGAGVTTIARPIASATPSSSMRISMPGRKRARRPTSAAKPTPPAAQVAGR